MVFSNNYIAFEAYLLLAPKCWVGAGLRKTFFGEAAFLAPTRHLGLTKGMLQRQYILLVKTIPFLVQQNVGLVPGHGYGRMVQYIHHRERDTYS
jgi:hypothetical protein